MPHRASTNSYLFSLALLRVYCALHLILKLFQLSSFIWMLFGPESWIKWSKTAFGVIPIEWLQYSCVPFFLVYFALLCLMLLGIGKNYVILAVWICVTIAQAWNGFILNGGDNLLKFVLLYLAFTNSFQYFCVKKPSVRLPASKPRKTIETLGRLSIALHLCLAYLISGLAKLTSEVWRNGEALKYVLQLDRFNGSYFNQWLIQHDGLILVACWSVITWELLAPFLLWNRLAKWPTMAAGVALHAGIYVCMMIHDFEVLFVMLYVIFITDREWRSIKVGASTVSARFSNRWWSHSRSPQQV